MPVEICHNGETTLSWAIEKDNLQGDSKLRKKKEKILWNQLQINGFYNISASSIALDSSFEYFSRLHSLIIFLT